MKIKDLNLSLIKLPSRIELTLFLIREDLKSRKFFDGLRKVGLDDAYYQPDLGSLILPCVGLDKEADGLYDFYYNLLGRHSKKIEADNNSIMKQAFNVYVELMIEKKKRNTQSS